MSIATINPNFVDPFLDTEIFKKYKTAESIITCRMVAEPYNMLTIAKHLKACMFFADNKVALACLELYKLNQSYGAFSVAQRAGIASEVVMQMTERHSETDLIEAFEVFKTIWGQYVEVHKVAQSVIKWAMEGKTSEEIKILSDKVRKEMGATIAQEDSDGKKEFESALFASIDGKVIDYPVKPPIDTIRHKLPYLEPGEYAIAAGRTGMGKSFFGLNWIYECCKNNIPSVYINLENTPKDVQKRLWQMECGVKWNTDFSKASEQEMQHYLDSWERTKKFPAKCINPGRNLQSILNFLRQEYYERGIQFATIDYIQLMREKEIRGGRVDEIAEISAAVRSLCLELNIPLLALAQISRAGEESADKRPKMIHLRGSGDLEQDASTIFLLYRPGYYNIVCDDSGLPYHEKAAEIEIAKGRNCGPFGVRCRFDEVRGFYSENDTFVEQEKIQWSGYSQMERPANIEDIPF